MHDFTCRELEVRIGEMENLVAEHPRDWKNNLLFHGIEMQPKETFYSLALIVSKIIRFEFNRKLITLSFSKTVLFYFINMKVSMKLGNTGSKSLSLKF